MPTFTWTNDIPGGVLKLHALSNQMVEATTSELVFEQFCMPIDGYGLHQGETASWTRASNMAEQASIVLAENERIPEYPVSISVRGAVVQEIGATVPIRSLAVDLSKFDVTNNVQRRLMNNLGLGMDTLAATAFKDCKHKYAITGLTANSITTNGVFAATSIANLNTFHLEAIGDFLYDTLQAPFFEDGCYIGIFRSLGIRGLHNDPDWAEWHKYTDPENKYYHEQGKWDRTRLIETNHAAALGKVGTGSVLGEGVVFGYDPVKFVEAMAPELRVGSNPEELGRRIVAGFLGIIRFGSTWGDSANAGEANIIHVGSL